MSLGKKLHDLRVAKSFTKEKIADELGVSKTAYGKWENDLTKPNFHHISVICDYYNITKDELMSDEKLINQNHNTFNHNSNMINSHSSTINYSISDEMLNTIIENQNNISEILKTQNVLFENFFKK